MQNLFLGMTLGGDPHTLGIYNAGEIAKKAGISFRLISPALSDEEKINIIRIENPRYLGLSYRLSTDVAISELKKFLKQLEDLDLLQIENGRKICFAGLLPTLKAVRDLGLDKMYGLNLMGTYSNLNDTTRQTAMYFDVQNKTIMNEIIESVKRKNEPCKIELLDKLAYEVIKNHEYLNVIPMKKPSNRALEYLPQRIREKETPIIRSHFGVPNSSIWPTVDGIKKISDSGAVDEISIGSSNLSQRYYGKPHFFNEFENDGGVPYKDINDLKILADSAKCGNFPSLKPYCHVANIIEFIDDCLKVGMLKGAHQAIPLFWFNELDGRGNMTLEESIDAHIDAVKYLAEKHIPVEMNDPNQWSSRYIHDTLFVVSYALIVSVMYAAGVQDIILQCQFNKPATTGDYADIGKFTAIKRLVEDLRPKGNTASIYYECRSGIEHFSTDLKVAKYQLARSTLLQMIINPSILHLVSYCEADHVATAEDVIESSQVLRHAVKLFKENEIDIRNTIDWDIVHKRADFLYDEALTVLNALVEFEVGNNKINKNELYIHLSKPSLLKKAMQYQYMTAPGITNIKYANSNIFTKPSEYGFLDCYENWEDLKPMLESERIKKIKQIYNL